MRILIASDIHGDREGCRALLTAMESTAADHLLLLGDIIPSRPPTTPKGW